MVTLLRWRIVELYYREVDELLYELSMTGEASEEMMAEAPRFPASKPRNGHEKP